ncbi:hypothetical protein IWX90DRAFT_495788 [Phyllosticta citrichinensis]|uniref:Uncharacterized protein n=1 Tax=Phyllosticta citrichinensis TaxID=1130410 RepID=A0ABR1XG47_9PEZI
MVRWCRFGSVATKPLIASSLTAKSLGCFSKSSSPCSRISRRLIAVFQPICGKPFGPCSTLHLQTPGISQPSSVHPARSTRNQASKSQETAHPRSNECPQNVRNRGAQKEGAPPSSTHATFTCGKLQDPSSFHRPDGPCGAGLDVGRYPHNWSRSSSGNFSRRGIGRGREGCGGVVLEDMAAGHGGCCTELMGGRQLDHLPKTQRAQRLASLPICQQKLSINIERRRFDWPMWKSGALALRHCVVRGTSAAQKEVFQCGTRHSHAAEMNASCELPVPCPPQQVV